KKVSRELVARYPDKFSKNYEENKVALAVLVDARTKRLRNRIVGYVTRLKIVEAKRAAAPGEIGPEGPDDQAYYGGLPASWKPPLPKAIRSPAAKYPFLSRSGKHQISSR